MTVPEINESTENFASFIAKFSVQKQMKAKAADAAMMRAMIIANSRVQVGTVAQQQEQQKEAKKHSMPILINKQPLYGGKSAAYKASMWLLK